MTGILLVARSHLFTAFRERITLFWVLIFPIFIYFLVISVLAGEIDPATVGTLVPGDPADAAGLEPGDKIVEIDGETIYGFEDLRNVVSSAAGREVSIAWERSK